MKRNTHQREIRLAVVSIMLALSIVLLQAALDATVGDWFANQVVAIGIGVFAWITIAFILCFLFKWHDEPEPKRRNEDCAAGDFSLGGWRIVIEKRGQRR